MTSARRRALGGVQLLLGAVTVLRPGLTVRAATAGHGDVPDPRIVRVLGTRQFVQGAITLVRPRPDVLRAGAVVDLSHAASLIPLIAFSRRYRAAALSSALLAGAAAAAGFSFGGRRRGGPRDGRVRSTRPGTGSPAPTP